MHYGLCYVIQSTIGPTVRLPTQLRVALRTNATDVEVQLSFIRLSVALGFPV